MELTRENSIWLGEDYREFWEEYISAQNKSEVKI